MSWLSYRTLAVAFLAAVATALALGAVVLLVRRDDNAPIQILLPTPEVRAAAPGTGSGAAPVDGGKTPAMSVYVSGAVRNPGVYPLGEDARLADALAAAGGATGDAQLESVNLALRVKDEAHYRIPRVGETPPPAPNTFGGQALAPVASALEEESGLIDLNSASEALLDTLPGIGKTLASAIVDYRERNGPFSSVEDIINVPKIGPATYEKIRDLVTVRKPP
jgi:competence protein ComEA